MNIAPLKAAGAIGVVLFALSLTSSAAAMMDPSAYAGSVRADSVGASIASGVQCPCNPDLPQASVASARSSLCPCNAGLPDAPPSAPITTGLLTTSGHPLRYGGGQIAGRFGVAPAPASQPRATSIQPHGTFDWADASIGSGVTVVIALLVAGAVKAVGRRRWHAEPAAASRR